MERFLKKKEPDGEFIQAPGVSVESRVERKRGPKAVAKEPDAIELPQKVRRTSRIANLEAKLAHVSSILSSSSKSEASGRDMLLEDQVNAQQTQIENLHATIQALRAGQASQSQLVSAPLSAPLATEEELEKQREAGRQSGHLGAQWGNLGGRPTSESALFDRDIFRFVHTT